MTSNLKKKRIHGTLYYISDDLPTIAFIFYDSLSYPAHLVQYKIKNVKGSRLSDNRTLSSRIPYLSKYEKMLLDSNKPSPNCISMEV
jgi:hypothetical protein